MGTLLKTLLSMGLLAIVLSTVDLHTLPALLVQTHPGWLAAAFALTLLRQWIAALRWDLMLRAKGLVVGIGRLVRYTFVSAFYNLVLPTSLGGDVVRVLLVARRIGSSRDALASVYVERLIGFVTLILLAIAALALAPSGLRSPGTVSAVALVFCGLLVVVLASFSVPSSWLGSDQGGPRWLSALRGRLARVHATVRAYRDQPKVLGGCAAWSLLYQFGAVLSIYLLGIALGIDLSLVDYLVLVPLVAVVTMLPLTISGIGLREGAYVLYLNSAGVDSASALLLSLLTFTINLLLGMLGGLIDLLSPAEDRP